MYICYRLTMSSHAKRRKTKAIDIPSKQYLHRCDEEAEPPERFAAGGAGAGGLHDNKPKPIRLQLLPLFAPKSMLTDNPPMEASYNSLPPFTRTVKRAIPHQVRLVLGRTHF